MPESDVCCGSAGIYNLVEPDTSNVACMRNCVAEVRLSSEMPAFAVDQHGNLADQRRDLGAIEGMKTVAAGGPADKAGLKGGDVIVEFGSNKVANIYDYTYAMDAARIGKPVTVVILRNGERLSISITPEARK